MIKAENLTKKYSGLKAVDSVSFEVEDGEIVGLLGPNGAGKTTIMRMLTCFLPPSEGSATLCGYSILKDSRRVRQNIGYLPENNPLYEDMRVKEYLNHRAGLKSIGFREKRRAIHKVLEKCWIEDVQNKMISSLSKGYRQRVGLGAALLGAPKILILDEPTVGLDPKQILETRKLIKELGKEHTILLSTHILHEAEALSDRVLILSEGKIIASDTTAKLREQMAGGKTIYVEVKGPDIETVKNRFLSLEGVTHVTFETRMDDYLAFLVQSSSETDPRALVYQTIKENNWQLRELTLRKMSLEDIFIQMTNQSTVPRKEEAVKTS